MRAGSLRHRAVLQSYTVTQNDIGDEVQSWSTVKSIWCDISPTSAGESFEAEQSVHRITHEIKLRGNAATIDSTMRLLYDSKYYYFAGLKDINLRGVQHVWNASEKAE